MKYIEYILFTKAGRMLTCTSIYQNKMMMTVSRNAMKNLTVTQRIIVVIKKMLCVCDIIEHVYLFLLISISSKCCNMKYLSLNHLPISISAM